MPTNTHRNADGHTHTPHSCWQLRPRWQEETTGVRQRCECGVVYRKEWRMKGREWRNALRRGNKRRMWHDSKPDSLSLPSSPTTQRGFEVRFYLVLLMLPPLTHFCTSMCVSAPLPPKTLNCKHSNAHRCQVWTGEMRKNQQQSQSPHWVPRPSSQCCKL